MSTIVLLDNQNNLLHNFNAQTIHMAKLVNKDQAFTYLIQNPTVTNWQLFKRFSSLPDLKVAKQVFKQCTNLSLEIVELLRGNLAYLIIYIATCKDSHLLPGKTVDETYDCLDPLVRDIIYTTTYVGYDSNNGKFWGHKCTTRLPGYHCLKIGVTSEEKLLALELLYANDILTYVTRMQVIT
jgi:hypothetical protein